MTDEDMSMNVENSVLQRYSEGAQARVEALCCPVDYDSGLLAILPQEIIERDYGCGDPSRYVREGDVVLDLGSGGGKICYMAAQLVGDSGHVIGVDMNDDMLVLARRHQDAMAARLGGNRVSFLKGRIQDLALDVDALSSRLAQHPVRSHADYLALAGWEQLQRRERPLVASESVDLVISNCVLNLVDDDDKQQLVDEIFRVLKPGGRIAIADIISDRIITPAMKQDPELWSGCISGSFQEQEMLTAFADAGFTAVCYDKWDARPWRVIDGITFRSVTLTALTPQPVAAPGAGRELLYRGPFAAVTGDDGADWQRGERRTVTDGTAQLLLQPAYGGAFIELSDTPADCSTPADPAADGCCSTQQTNRGCC
ncbi:MAG: methyltransferase domain-containing protein [Gammaproteobacteria bacterium]